FYNFLLAEFESVFRSDLSESFTTTMPNSFAYVGFVFTFSISRMARSLSFTLTGITSFLAT
ncbi:MAG: hypothetical protein UE295_04470, partial [Acutalibacteraceae bacterium]|nr:hypothetical protein [Acutalibacteraceae bacterium]